MISNVFVENIFRMFCAITIFFGHVNLTKKFSKCIEQRSDAGLYLFFRMLLEQYCLYLQEKRVCLAPWGDKLVAWYQGAAYRWLDAASRWPEVMLVLMQRLKLLRRLLPQE